MLERLWASWRLEAMRNDREAGTTGVDPTGALTLFEAIERSDEPDHVTHVVWRGPLVYAVLNRYPYTNGHLLVVPNRAVRELEDLDEDEHRELWATVRAGVGAVKRAFGCEGVNVGANLGVGSGPSVTDHLHVHVVPRWSADTNFMTAIAEARVLPESLAASWTALRDAWPTS